jgi:hypothetical protein
MRTPIASLACLILAFAVTANTASADVLNHFDPYQWTSATCTGLEINCAWAAPSTFGAVTAFSNYWYPEPESVGTGFTPPLANEFYADTVGDSVVMTLPIGLNWGKAGGELILGNIHNFYEYNLSATDSSGNPINVNDWTYLGVDLTPVGSHPDPVSSTSTCTFGGFLPDGSACPGTSSSEDFYVYDTSACGGSILACEGTSQGGVVALGNLPSTVSTITLTLESDNLGDLEGGYSAFDLTIFNSMLDRPLSRNRQAQYSLELGVLC